MDWVQLSCEWVPQLWRAQLTIQLGAFGMLNGPKFAAAGGTPNAAFHDQRAVFEWAQKHVSLFGGDPRQVTVMGESAGGSSILHQITAYGGQKAPFNQAILQSPAFIPKPLKAQSDSAFASFLSNANVTTLAQLRALDTLTLQTANKLTQNPAFYGTFAFGMY